MKPFQSQRRSGGASSVILACFAPFAQFLYRLVLHDVPAPDEIALPLCASVLVLLLIPVPYNRRYHLRILEPAVLAVGILPVFGCPSWITVILMLGFSFMARHILSRRKTLTLSTSVLSYQFRDSAEERYSDSLAMVWTGLPALTLCGPVPALSASVACLLLASVLLCRIRSGNPLSTIPSFEMKLKEASRQAEEAARPAEGIESERVLYERCCRYMTEKKPYLVESFSISDLANAVYTNKSYLSRTINNQSGKNFRKFLNEYRISYSKDLFMRNMSLKVNDLAELSGFHTITTYTMAFEAIMGESPSSWCRRMRINSLK
ncbi:MAG: helix-turn-helix transcriptional regulator [Bacteroidales bacterium]|nr:helix-turn-helix transcriptional regulator [Bacteroidales bacterium]